MITHHDNSTSAKTFQGNDREEIELTANVLFN